MYSLVLYAVWEIRVLSSLVHVFYLLAFTDWSSSLTVLSLSLLLTTSGLIAAEQGCLLDPRSVSGCTRVFGGRCLRFQIAKSQGS